MACRSVVIKGLHSVGMGINVFVLEEVYYVLSIVSIDFLYKNVAGVDHRLI